MLSTTKKLIATQGSTNIIQKNQKIVQNLSINTPIKDNNNDTIETPVTRKNLPELNTLIENFLLYKQEKNTQDNIEQLIALLNQISQIDPENLKSFNTQINTNLEHASALAELIEYKKLHNSLMKAINFIPKSNSSDINHLAFLQNLFRNIRSKSKENNNCSAFILDIKKLTSFHKDQLDTELSRVQEALTNEIVYGLITPIETSFIENYFIETKITNQDIIKNLFSYALKEGLEKISSEELKKNIFALVPCLNQMQQWIKSGPYLLERTICEKLADQAIIMILDPCLIHQQGSLCGVDVYLRLLITHHPQAFLNMVICLFTTGKCDYPLKITMNFLPDYQKLTIDKILMCVIRQNYNWTSYHPNGFFTYLRGLTRPKTLVNWLQESGFRIVYDHLSLKNKHGYKITYPTRQFTTLVGGLYSTVYCQEIMNDNSLTTIQKALDSKSQSAIILISTPLTRLIVTHYCDKKDFFEIPENANYYFYDSHYAVIKKLNIIENDDKVICEIEIDTYGEIFNLSIPKGTFIKHLLGYLIVEPDQTLSLTLSNQNKVTDIAQENLRNNVIEIFQYN